MDRHLPKRGTANALLEPIIQVVTRPKSARRHGFEDVVEVRLDARTRRAVLEALGESSVPADDVIEDVEIILAITSAARRYPRPANRRRLLRELIAALDRSQRALLDLDATSWDELVQDIDREKVELPFAFQRYIADVARRRGKEKEVADLMAASNVPLPPPIPTAIAELARSARHQLAQLERTEGRGKPSEVIRNSAIRQLAEVFHRSAEEAYEYRGRLIDFVSAALRAAKMPVPKSDEKVWALVPRAERSHRLWQ